MSDQLLTLQRLQYMLKSAPSGLLTREIVERTGRSQSSICNALDRLAQRGAAYRKAAHGEGRMCFRWYAHPNAPIVGDLRGSAPGSLAALLTGGPRQHARPPAVPELHPLEQAWGRIVHVINGQDE